MNFQDFGYAAKRFADYGRAIAAGFEDGIKKGEKEMFVNYKDLDNIKVCYNGRLYAPSSVEVTEEYNKLSPRFRLEFYPDEMSRTGMRPKGTVAPHQPKIEKVIFNGPATIVFWDDKTKTIVKSNVDTYDPEKGLVMAIAKKFLGNKGNYYNTIRKCLENAEYYYDEDSPEMDANVLTSMLATFLGGH